MDSPGARGRVPASPVQEDQRPYVNLDKLQNDNVEREELCHHQLEPTGGDLNGPYGPAARRSAGSVCPVPIVSAGEQASPSLFLSF